MFTGIIEATGKLVERVTSGTNFDLRFESEISQELQVDQSISHNGVCLTVTKVDGNQHWVTAIDETLKRSNLGELEPGDRINLERCMKADGRFDGHIVQGHVDTEAEVTAIAEEDGSWLFRFGYPPTDEVLVDKGSITVTRVSLTCFDATDSQFSVAIIPYTYEHTNFGNLKVGDKVNLEFDILGKYMRKLLARRTDQT